MLQNTIKDNFLLYKGYMILDIIEQRENDGMN